MYFYFSRSIELVPTQKKLPPRVICDQCGSTFASNVSLREHLAVIHKVGAKFTCGTCGKTYTSKGGTMITWIPTTM